LNPKVSSLSLSLWQSGKRPPSFPFLIQ
jgi:hypothetical protein